MVNTIFEFIAPFITVAAVGNAGVGYLALSIAGTIVTFGETYIESTKSKKDDRWYKRLKKKAPARIVLGILKKFSWWDRD